MDDDADAWGASGLACLTGPADGLGDFSRAAVLTEARSTAARFTALTGVDVDAAELLAGRAALLGLTRRGRTSAGGATRLLPASDGWFALTLSRTDDVHLVPALVEEDSVDDPWAAVRRWARGRTPADVVERARLLDLPAAVLGEATPAAPVVRRIGTATAPRTPAGLLVVDLSSMWAGPSCAQLLRRAGATVVKVESPSRPDGTRAGPSAFFDWVNGGKLSYATSFDDEGLRILLEAADVVVESSRPAGLRRRGLGPADVTGRGGRVWLGITGYRDELRRVAFGDDAAVAGGLVGRGPVFCGDAIADPLTGLHAALAVVEALHRGGGEEVRVAMADVAATYAALPLTDGTGPVLAPVAPRPTPPAAALDADHARVVRLLDERSPAPC
ncbi:CoA transferase [Mycolicibacterium sediminis]|uniref:CoA transferase n=1 Tax=Mycolicibacterium sediminis TaxID=1286180 RepID=A0A7I7QM98_9MYCO|nr:CoA transferase [Mycolicibacterium sediminis]BBY27421.1 CoA transferase [Mycolicibacterium sediminis]